LGNPFYYVGADSDGKNSIEIGAYGVPETYIVNSNGIIVFKHVGPINEVIYETIVKILK
jgi:cytochrome c biogenesis protein CcmG, thiol:disulfide interchange protein DsbE